MSVQQVWVSLDSNTRRSANGTALVGGSPFRLLRLSRRGSGLLDRWLAGGPAPVTDSEVALLRRLLDAGLVHPRPRVGARQQHELRVGFVVPVFNDPVGLQAAIAAIRADWPEAPVVVVDDASTAPPPEVAATVVAHSLNLGPGAARNTGVAELDAAIEIVVFVDSDVVPAPGSLALLLGHFDDPAVVAAAPRVRAAAGSRSIDRYEADASPLDLGPQPAIVRPGSPVPFVPSTVLAVRRAAFDAAGGFHAPMRVGEDVDLVWRLVAAGGVVRYEPAAEAHHRVRPRWWALARQRHGYGSAAAPLEARHPGDVRPVEMPGSMLAAWALALLGGVAGLGAGVGVSVYDAMRLRARLAALPDRNRQTLLLTARGHRHAARWLAHAVRRAWLPVVVPAAMVSRRARRILIGSVAVAVAFEGRRNLAAGVIDDAAYCSGLWRGAARSRSVRVLLPRLTRRS